RNRLHAGDPTQNGLPVHDRPDLPGDYHAGPVDHLVAVLDAGLQVFCQGLVVLFDLPDGAVDGVAEGVTDVLALVSDPALSHAEVLDALDVLDQGRHLLLDFLNAGVTTTYTRFSHFLEHFPRLLLALVQRTPVRDVSGVPQGDTLGHLVAIFNILRSDAA